MSKFMEMKLQNDQRRRKLKTTTPHTAGPKSAIVKDNQKKSIIKQKKQWEETTKGAITKEFFPSVENRLAVNLKLSPKATTIKTGHGNIRSHLHRLKITGSPESPCKQGTQTVDHLILQCKRLKNEREILENSALKAGNWPGSKSELTNKKLKQLISYINSTDLEKPNHSK